MKNLKNRNECIISCVSCIVIILVMCYFMFSSTTSSLLKGTLAVSYKTVSCVQGNIPSGCTYIGNSQCTCPVNTEVSSCASGYHVENGICVKDSTMTEDGCTGSNCGSSGSSTASCDYNNQSSCQSATHHVCAKSGSCWISGVTACVDGYTMITGGSCVKGSSSTSSCTYNGESQCITYSGYDACSKGSDGCWYPYKSSSSSSSSSSGSRCPSGSYDLGVNGGNKAASIGAKMCGNGNYTLTQDIEQGCWHISCTEPCDCGDDGDCSESFNACWNCSGSYKYGVNTAYEDSCTQVNTSLCYSNSEYTSCWKCDSGYVTGTNTKYASSCSEVSTYYCTATPSNSGSTPSSTPTSNPSSSYFSSSSEEIITNPQTGEIAIFIMWVIAFGAICYSFWYFKKAREN